jgi:septal ring factor EnvC (AmiA/AmiB activator)
VTSGRQLQLVALLILLLGTGITAAAPTATRAREDLRELRGKIEALQQRLTDAEESKTEAADALRESERAISDASRRLRELGQQSSDVRQRLAALRAASRDNETTLTAQRALLAKLLYQQYLGGRSESLKLLLNGENPNQIARQMHYFSYISRAHATLITSLRAHLARLKALAQDVEHQLAELTTIASRQTVQKKRLESEKRARRQVLTGIARDIRKQKRKIGTLKRDENRLTRLIEQLGKIIARVPPRRSIPRLKNERLPDGAGDGSPFEDLKGTLRLPVRGELGNRFGSPRSDSGLNWKGLFIDSKPGEEVHAIAAGRVVFADWLRGFGNLMIIDHGDGYMSLYGNNETLYKQVGETIRGGETVAAVGNSGGNTDSGLYFEIRYQGKPFDPLTWVNVK